MADEKEVYVGAVIEINQKPLNLIPSTPVNKIDDLGLKLSLDKPLELGNFGDAMDSICNDLGLSNPLSKKALDGISSPLLQKVANKVATANMRIEALEYDQPPAKENADTKYLFVASVNWKDEKPNSSSESESKDFFKLKGLIVGVSSGYTDATTGVNKQVKDAFQSALGAMTSASTDQAALPSAPNGRGLPSGEPVESK